ncbi:hypothetical protein EHS14_00245 [Schaalia georgiae]|nr:hypothetical protein EHS14_00245 [Schaalia georgiae]
MAQFVDARGPVVFVEGAVPGDAVVPDSWRALPALSPVERAGDLWWIDSKREYHVDFWRRLDRLLEAVIVPLEDRGPAGTGERAGSALLG